MSAHVNLPHLLPWSTFALCWLALGTVVVMAHRLFRRWISRLEPNQRASMLISLALMPVISAAIVTLLNFAPGVGGIVFERHCPAGGDCLRHVPVFCADITHAILLTLGPAMLTGVAVWMLCARLNRTMSVNRMLSCIVDLQAGQAKASADPARAGGSHGKFKVIETPALFAYCAGFVRGRLIVSRGLVDALTPTEFAAVIAHEQAHSDRFDNARRMLALIGLWLVPPSWSRALLRDLAFSSETVCDQAAARRTGNVQTVIAAVKAIMRLDRPVVESLGAAFVHPRGDAVPADDGQQRIDELLDDSKLRLPMLVLPAGMVIIYAYAVVAVSEVTHHIVERLLV